MPSCQMKLRCGWPIYFVHVQEGTVKKLMITHDEINIWRFEAPDHFFDLNY